jgi:hypothetical protein
MLTVEPGDLLCVRSPGLAGKLIRIGAEIAGRPGLANHVAVVHHTDAKGICWCLEGRPGGVGWRDAADYLRSPYTIANTGQPKTRMQRAGVCTTVRVMLGTAYDWEAIAADAGMAFGLRDIWGERAGGTLPGEVVCSSLAAYAYDRNGLAAPAPADYAHVTPGDWVALIMEHRWDR